MQNIQIGERVRFIPIDPRDVLAPGQLDGTIIYADSTSGGNIRYEVRLGPLIGAEQDCQSRRVYSNQGRFARLDVPLSEKQISSIVDANIRREDAETCLKTLGLVTEQVLVFNGKLFAEFKPTNIGMLDPAVYTGLFERKANGHLLYAPDGKVRAFIVNNRHNEQFVVSASIQCGAIWYMYSTTSQEQKWLGLDTLSYSECINAAESIKFEGRIGYLAPKTVSKAKNPPSGSIDAALADLQQEIADGAEYPDAHHRQATAHGVSADELQEAYDAADELGHRAKHHEKESSLE